MSPRSPRQEHPAARGTAVRRGQHEPLGLLCRDCVGVRRQFLPSGSSALQAPPQIMFWHVAYLRKLLNCCSLLQNSVLSRRHRCVILSQLLGVRVSQGPLAHVLAAHRLLWALPRCWLHCNRRRARHSSCHSVLHPLKPLNP